MTPKPKGWINIQAERGENCLFSGPMISAINESNIHEVDKKLDSYIRKYDKPHDDRAFAIIGALSIENELDLFLAKWLLNYGYLKEHKNLSFSKKIDLAIGSRLIPKRILTSIEPINKIRNIFAHNLEINSFAEAKDYDPKPFRNLYDKIKTFQEWDIDDDKRSFRQLIILIILALDIYRRHAIILRDFIWNRENLNKIMKKQI